MELVVGVEVAEAVAVVVGIVEEGILVLVVVVVAMMVSVSIMGVWVTELKAELEDEGTSDFEVEVVDECVRTRQRLVRPEDDVVVSGGVAAARVLDTGGFMLTW